ncbi:pre-peptidase C-terminal domain-containing protein [Evansella caseinilytica]|uniref:Pre-peptidase C-terminal domain-containing protein n=1 Tax=Evansella caseinilytica TaxID=1503961 RepID=A0A1H3UG21_9BACI|nr:PPC domain-containing protein [Evansella caseinilytica]SDZ61334.1 pre-peptidase C-terminal domain-containing protein [Evansella caseinilytica]
MKFLKISVFIALTLIFTGTGLTTVFANEALPDVSSDSNLEFFTYEDSPFTEVSADPALTKDTDIKALLKAVPEMKASDVSIQNDPYEPNDTIDTAASIPYGQTIYANIGRADDIDWYKVNLTAGTDVAFLLKNIPAGTDYDLYVFDPNLNYAVSENSGNLDEKLYISIQTSGTWYVAVVPYSGYNPDQNYSLFVGNAWRTGSYSAPTSMTFNYNSSNVGTILPYQTLDLRQVSAIPDTARVTSISFYTYSSFGNWGNQIKYIYSYQTGNWYETFVGLNYVLDLPSNLFVKQQWPITTSIQTLFTPTASYSPGINFSYQYLIE